MPQIRGKKKPTNLHPLPHYRKKQKKKTEKQLNTP